MDATTIQISRENRATLEELSFGYRVKTPNDTLSALLVESARLHIENQDLKARLESHANDGSINETIINLEKKAEYFRQEAQKMANEAEEAKNERAFLKAQLNKIHEENKKPKVAKESSLFKKSKVLKN